MEGQREHFILKLIRLYLQFIKLSKRNQLMSDLKVSQIHGEAIGEEGKKTRLEGRPCCSDEITIQQLRNKYKEEALDIKRKIHQRG